MFQIAEKYLPEAISHTITQLQMRILYGLGKVWTFAFFFFFFTEIQLTYSIVLVSEVQYNDLIFLYML